MLLYWEKDALWGSARFGGGDGVACARMLIDVSSNHFLPATTGLHEKYGQPPVGTDAALHQYIVKHTREPQVCTQLITVNHARTVNHV